MKRTRIALGLAVGALLVASGLGHCLLGWRQLGAELAVVKVPPDLRQALAIGWSFGGVAMITFGCIVLMLFAGLARGRAVSLRPAQVIALAYVLFGTCAFVAAGFAPFFLVFIVPGLLLAFASWGWEGSAGSP